MHLLGYHLVAEKQCCTCRPAILTDAFSSKDDMVHARTRSSHVAGVSKIGDFAGGDPSPWTALGVFESLRACVRYKLGKDLSGVKVAIQGVGNVVQHLCRLLAADGATLVIADVNTAVAAQVAQTYGAELIPSCSIASSDVDVFAPCAMGGVLDETGIAQLRAGIVVGGANNQCRRYHQCDCGVSR
jgi:leucine dehydrogenase